MVFCAVCHGPEGEGGPLGKAFNTFESKNLSDSDIVNVITKGKPDTGMTPFEGGLSQTEIFLTMLYIREFQGDKRTDTPSAISSGLTTNPLRSEASLRGETIFVEKLSCAKCHSYDTRGGFIGPDITEIAARMPAEDIQQAVIAPSAYIKSGFGAKELRTKDGETVKGRFRNETDDSLQILNAEGTLWTTYFKKDLEAIRDARNSLMPNGLTSNLSKDETADLFAFLESLK